MKNACSFIILVEVESPRTIIVQEKKVNVLHN